MLTITKEYVRALLFVVNMKFSFNVTYGSMVFWVANKAKFVATTIRGSMFCSSTVKTEVFLGSIRLRFSTLFTDSYWLALWPCLSQQTHGWGVGFCSLVWKTPSNLCFWSLFNVFLGFLPVHFLNESTSFVKSNSSHLSSSPTRSALYQAIWPKSTSHSY